MVSTGVLENAKRRLDESSYGFQRRVDAAYDNGVITLRGRVPTYYLKQTAQTLVSKVDGVDRVVNLVDVYATPRVAS